MLTETGLQSSKPGKDINNVSTILRENLSKMVKTTKDAVETIALNNQPPHKQSKKASSIGAKVTKVHDYERLVVSVEMIDDHEGLQIFLCIPLGSSHRTVVLKALQIVSEKTLKRQLAMLGQRVVITQYEQLKVYIIRKSQ